MQVIADLHLHSRFSRAVSSKMTIVGIAEWARKKGIGLVATGDWTHPMWMREIGEKLEEDGSGLLRLKNSKIAYGNQKMVIENGNEKVEKNPISTTQFPQPISNFQRPTSPLFLLSTEISCIYSQAGKTRRVHVLVWLPSLASAQKINQELTRQGCNLMSDGRPIIGLSLIRLSELVLTIEPNALIIPAHIWTPWFSVYGSMGGFESLDEAFGGNAKKIYAVETGLSSSPDMNWRIEELDSRAIVSFSDAHSGPKLGREVTVFELPEVTYENIRKALMFPTHAEVANKDFDPSSVASSTPPSPATAESSEAGQNFIHSPYACRIAYTIEFYPEEGKYHYTGHRECHIRFSPDESKQKGTTCPVCGKPLTQGVMQRVEKMATRQGNNKSIRRDGKPDLSFIEPKGEKRPPFIMLVPLQEIIAEAIGSPVTSPKTQLHYERLTSHFAGEFNVLLHASIEEIARLTTPQIGDGIKKVRVGDIVVDPGYDGVFGVVKIWKSDEEKALVDRSKEQLGLF